MATKKKKEEDDNLEDLPEVEDQQPEEEDFTDSPKEEGNPFAEEKSKHYVKTMDIIFNKKDLKHAMSFLKKCVRGKTSLPILDDFHISFHADGSCVLTLTDLEIIAKYTITELKIPFDFIICVKSEEIIKIIDACIYDSITLSIENDILRIVDGFDEFQMELFDDPTNFPIGKDLVQNEEHAIKFNKDVFVHSIKECLIYTGVDELRMTLTGINLKTMNDKLHLAATNAHMLKYIQVEDLRKGSYDVDIILCKSFANAITLIEDGEETMQIYVDRESESAYVVSADGKQAVSGRLVDGKYPNYPAIIPKEGFNVIDLELKTFLRDIKRMISVGGEMPCIELNFYDDQMVIKSQSMISQKTNKIKTDVVTPKGWSVEKIGFNPKFLHAILNQLEGEKVFLHIISVNKAMILTCNGDTNGDISLLMPVMLNT